MGNWKTQGQDHIIHGLERSHREGRLSHAYLLVGPPHVGRMTLAVDLAQAVNCLSGQEKPCGECVQCQRIKSSAHTDVQVIALNWDERTNRLRTEIMIDQIRAMEKAASLKPYEGTCRVFIINGVERMNHYAANALLKTLEEPPPQVLLLLLTSDEQALLPTIRSRCQRLELRPLAQESVAGLLMQELALSPERALLLARLSSGRLGWAMTAAADTAVLDERDRQLDRILEVVDGRLEVRFEYAQELAAQFTRDRESARQVLGQWLQWWCDLLVLKEGVQELVVNQDRREALERMVQRFLTRQVATVVHEVLATLDRLEQNANPRLALEVLMLTLPKADAVPV